MTRNERYEAIKAIINAWDPEGLLAMGAPDDEYDPETLSILWSRYRMTNAKTATQVVDEVFEHYFWPGSSVFHDPEIGAKVWAVFEADEAQVAKEMERA